MGAVNLSFGHHFWYWRQMLTVRLCFGVNKAHHFWYVLCSVHAVPTCSMWTYLRVKSTWSPLENYKRLWIWFRILCPVPWNPLNPHELTCSLRPHSTILNTHIFYIFNNEKRLYYLPSRVPAAPGLGGSFGCSETWPQNCACRSTSSHPEWFMYLQWVVIVDGLSWGLTSYFQMDGYIMMSTTAHSKFCQ